MARRSDVPEPLRPEAPGQVLKKQTLELEGLNAEALDELARRLESIGRSYSTLAQQVGALYIKADGSGLDGFTRALDRPMRNASTDQQTFEALLDAAQQARRDQGG
jgi:hypothetical protein